jgi:hypothetical protein
MSKAMSRSQYFSMLICPFVIMTKTYNPEGNRTKRVVIRKLSMMGLFFIHSPEFLWDT